MHLLKAPFEVGVREEKSAQEIVFLCFESPWPPFSGAQKRSYGLLVELARAYQLDLRLICRKPLTVEQRAHLGQFASRIVEIPRIDQPLHEKLATLMTAAVCKIPYHVAMVQRSIESLGSVPLVRVEASGKVYASSIAWTSPIQRRRGPRWIVDQPDADVQFWDLYGRQHPNALMRIIAQLNKRLMQRYCRIVYPNAGCLISVSEEDRALTQQIDPAARVEVIENGVDCDEFAPDPTVARQCQLLFTGTSAPRNMVALRRFIARIYPRVRAAVPEVSFVIAGDFRESARAEFAGVPGIILTGKVADLRPYYHQSAVFVNPFDEIYGSKLKVAEALAMGICIVSFPGGVRGMPVVANESVLIGSTDEELAQQIVRALQQPDLAARIGNSGRAVAERHLDWRRVLGPRLRRIVATVMQGQTDSDGPCRQGVHKGSSS